MVWKQDLAKLKRGIQDGTAASGPAKTRRPEPLPAQEPRPMENEDALFLAAMGHKPASGPTSIDTTIQSPVVEPSVLEPTSQVDFETSMSSLKGLKRASSKIPGPARASKVAPPISKPLPVVADQTITTKEALPVPTEPAAPAVLPQEPVIVKPNLIHLAAGMAIEVDGSLDLRGHNTKDLVARLMERILDGACLGWRTLHVILGPSEELREAFLSCLQGQGSRRIARYAQAPIPMGGSQAWILYYGSPGMSPRSEPS